MPSPTICGIIPSVVIVHTLVCKSSRRRRLNRASAGVLETVPQVEGPGPAPQMISVEFHRVSRYMLPLHFGFLPAIVFHIPLGLNEGVSRHGQRAS
jgi:hypothetical protein